MTRSRSAALLAASLLLAAPLRAQSSDSERRPVDISTASTFVGGGLIYAAPQGEFKKYVGGAIGLGGHFLQALDDQGIIALRADVNIMTYGSRTVRQPLGGGALGLISADVTTSNNILNAGVGLQLVVPRGTIRPYLDGTLGFSYFWTQSSVEGSSGGTGAFASSQNFSDSGFSTAWGSGIYIPLSVSKSPVILDIGAQVHKNADIQYLTKNSITFSGTSAPPTITPVRSSADFITWRLGVSIPLR
jgi:hypothetical protein